MLIEVCGLLLCVVVGRWWFVVVRCFVTGCVLIADCGLPFVAHCSLFGVCRSLFMLLCVVGCVLCRVCYVSCCVLLLFVVCCSLRVDCCLLVVGLVCVVVVVVCRVSLLVVGCVLCDVARRCYLFVGGCVAGCSVMFFGMCCL